MCYVNDMEQGRFPDGYLNVRSRTKANDAGQIKVNLI